MDLQRDVDAKPIGWQSSKERFETRQPQHNWDWLLREPPIAPWRCNLTGLSQTHNLFFVAYGAFVYVYQPHFPSQRLPERPALIVPPHPPSPSPSPGSSNPTSPVPPSPSSFASTHSSISRTCNVNYLLVHHLGNEEVIATVHDHGLVNVVLVRHIVQAIHRRNRAGAPPDELADHIRSIFHMNVGASAWGLAIHSQARLLATSSNLHEICIFRFGLSVDGTDTYGDMAQSVMTKITGGTSNIPHIAFCNTGDDPTGRWLLATDISGFCRILDLHNLTSERPAQTWRFGSGSVGIGGLDVLNAGWIIAFLDRRSFFPESDWRRAIGLIKEDQELPGASAGLTETVWNLTEMATGLPDNSPVFMPHTPHAHDPPSTRTTDRIRDDSVLSPLPDAGVATEREMISGAQQGVSLGDDPIEPEIVISDGRDTDNAGSTDDLIDHRHALGQNDTHSLNDGPHDDVDLGMADEDIDMLLDEPPDDHIRPTSHYSHRQFLSRTVRFVQSANPTSICDGLQCPILHGSVQNVYLVQPGHSDVPTQPFCFPLMGFGHPLTQAVFPPQIYLNHFDRCNMSAYIVSLGIVVVASQKGRAMVLSLHQIPSTTQIPRRYSHPADPKDRIIYTMRAEYILPFQRQENLNQRPFKPLHGIAVGPMQGTENLPVNRQRWRLMMMYQDHSILAYELTRRRVQEASVDVSCLVV